MKAKIIILVLLLGLPFSVYGQGLIKIGNITSLEGEHNNTIHGFGLVSGLLGTGDQGDADKVKAELALLRNMGTDVNESDITSKNMAYVVVTGVLKPYMKKGQVITVIVSSKGSAKSLKGGKLLSTMLFSPYLGNKRVFAIASGPIRIDEKSLNTGTVQAVIEEEVPVSYLKVEGGELVFNLNLSDPNFVNARTIANDINMLYGSSDRAGDSDGTSTKLAKAIDAGKIRITVPEKYVKNNDANSFIAEIQEIPITDYALEGRVLVNSRTGTVIISGSVMMEPVAIAHNDLVIKIEDPRNPNNQVDRSLASLPGGANLDALVKSLNMLGVKPLDLVGILEKLHKQGALHAKLEID